MSKDILIEKLAESLDITPSQFQEASSRFNNITNYLKSQKLNLDTYLQGSFRLGTVIRPYAGLEERDYDLDIVCEVLSPIESLGELKNGIGNILKSSSYSKYLDEEGKRCWTLNYKEVAQEGFHIDILPCKPDSHSSKSEKCLRHADVDYSGLITLTHKNKDGRYAPRSSNPKGFAGWFHNINHNIQSWNPAIEKAKAFDANKKYFTENLNIVRAADIPPEFVRSPLQKTIQILKRHRDVMFSKENKNEEYKPISIIITVLVASIAERFSSKYTTTKELLSIVLDNLDNHSKLFNYHSGSVYSNDGLIKRFNKNNQVIWQILNPADPDENLADRWHEDDDARAKCFFEWVKAMKGFLLILEETKESEYLTLFKTYFGTSTGTRALTLYDSYKSKQTVATQNITTSAKPYGHG